ncbi:hypothetical protein AMAG_17751 [Allomyces macrogynus ATCC 38327]|uniref:CHCH domain-containing protein n=1 Tax=Allomyces macrogynus (strain ATCC 38327) TaxID=578462 RepID=A0A0L0RYN2_ALLM3|nr:hypothetical protein AMAG_17751 [Allomyces macrogynus ATCC 38327]|eukprot:KNE55194.1 hypothetical protein AMAG_17751 [Allomyces macrogynus ATCC 38327]
MALPSAPFKASSSSRPPPPNASIAYGKCVASNTADIHQDRCAREFLAFKQCVTQKAGRKW